MGVPLCIAHPGNAAGLGDKCVFHAFGNAAVVLLRGDVMVVYLGY